MSQLNGPTYGIVRWQSNTAAGKKMAHAGGVGQIDL
jgi:hypothetical protein